VTYDDRFNGAERMDQRMNFRKRGDRLTLRCVNRTRAGGLPWT